MHSVMSFAVYVALLPAAFALIVSQGSASEKAARVLMADGSAELLKLGYEVRQPDQLDKVKEMISHMIAKHQAAAADDTSHKGFCDKEMVDSKSKVEKLDAELQKRKADEDLHSAQLAELKDSISDLHESIAKAHKSKQQAAGLREKEAASYKKNTADWDTSLQSLRRARQSDIRSARQAAIKEVEDITLKKVKAENSEEDAQYRYKKIDGEIAVEIARKTKEVEQKERKVISRNHDLSLGDGDFKMAQEEMAAAKDYATKIKSSCVNRVDPAEERKASREKQIASMKEAYTILNGEAIP